MRLALGATAALATGLLVVPAALASSHPVQHFVGLWKAVDTSVQTTTKTATYFEFRANGTWCSSYTTEPVYKCSTFESYSTEPGNIISTAEGKKTKPPWRYRWTALGASSMELRSEIQLGPPHGWTTLAKYALARTTVAKPTPTPAVVRNDQIPPKVVSLTTQTRRNPTTKEIETIVSCRATDNVGLKDVSIGYREPGVKAGGLTWYRKASTKDTKPRDQTWTDTFPTTKAGTYTAVCSATDKAKWSSGTVEKSFSVNPGAVKGAVSAANVAQVRAYLDVLNAVRVLYLESQKWDFALVNEKVAAVKDQELTRRWEIARRSTNLKERSYTTADVNEVYRWAIQKMRELLK